MNTLYTARDTASQLIAKSNKSDATALARALFNDIDPLFQYSTNVSFTKAMTNVRELRLFPKRSKATKKKERRKHYRNFKDKVEEQMKLTEVERSV